jgi:hypothetical protein
MDLRRLLTVMSVSFAVALLFSGSSEAANGTVRVTFKYKDGSGIEQSLPYAYLYLRFAAEKPPLQKYFKSADYIFGPSNSSGLINASVPEGTYYIRLTRREPLGGAARPLGPPEKGDYTWTDYKQITVVANTVINLGTKFAVPFTEAITISGAIKDKATGTPLAGRFVRAQSEPCIEADYSSWDPAEWIDSNRCGPEVYLAQQKTDAQGKYTLLLRDPGSYYIVIAKTLGDHHQQYSGNRSTTGWTMGPISVKPGDNIVLEDMKVPAPY